MTSRSASALRKPAAQRKAAAKKSAAKTKGGNKAAKLPEWNLADLYSGIDAPEVTRDLEKMDVDCVAFETDYKGKLADQTAEHGGGVWLAEAVRRYEAIEISPAASAPMPGWFTPATASTPRSPNSTATSPSG
jgi:oligoendopeptidase F